MQMVCMRFKKTQLWIMSSCSCVTGRPANIHTTLARCVYYRTLKMDISDFSLLHKGVTETAGVLAVGVAQRDIHLHP